MEIAIGAVIAVLAGILTPPIAKAIELWWRNRITVKRIKNPKDKKYINQLTDLYCEIFPDGFNADELYEYIQSSLKSDKRPVEVDDIWLIAKRGGNVVGFFFCHYYPKQKKSWVSYYGIVKPKELPENTISSKLLKKILLYLKKQKCEYLFFDILRSKKSLIKRFKKDAKTNDVEAWVLKFDYKAPKISDSSRPNSQLTLMFIPLGVSFERPIKREIINNFLDFVYLDCYGDIYEITDSRYEKFKKYLANKLQEVKKEIPETVDVE